MATKSTSLSDRGRRKNNEDFVAYFEPTDAAELMNSGCLYIVADGVGGAAKGERASQFASQKVLYDYYQSFASEPLEHLREIVEQVNDDIYSYAEQNHTRMATTIVAVVVRGGLLYVANVGDSRAYLIRDKNVTQINRDHSIVGELVENGEMSEAEARDSRVKNRLTRSLGGDPHVTVDVYPPIQLITGDRILLCSDGLTRYALREDLSKITEQGTLEEIAQRLVGFANKNGGADNISVIMVEYQDTNMLEPTIRIKRPQAISLDTLDTQPDKGLVNRTKSVKAHRSKISKIAPYFTASFGLIVILIFLGIYSWNNHPSLPPQRTKQAEVALKAGTNTAIAQATGTAIVQATGTAQQIAENMAATQAADTATALAIVANQSNMAASSPPINPEKVAPPIGDKSLISAVNECVDPLSVFKTADQSLPIMDAHIESGATFFLTGNVLPGSTSLISGFYFETDGPINSMTDKKGWVWYQDSCIRNFLQGTNPMEFNKTTMQFEKTNH